MRKIAIVLAAAAALLAGPALQANERLTGEQELAKCSKAASPASRSAASRWTAPAITRVIDKTAIVYDAGTYDLCQPAALSPNRSMMTTSW